MLQRKQMRRKIYGIMLSLAFLIVSINFPILANEETNSLDFLLTKVEESENNSEISNGEDKEVEIARKEDEYLPITEQVEKTTQIIKSRTLAPNEAVVTNAMELSEMISANNGVDTIYLANDITLNGGIVVPSTKVSITIDGTWDGVTHTLYEVNSSMRGNGITITNNQTKNMTLQNMNIQGYSLYGPMQVADTVNSVILAYRNITYTGPKLSYNYYGTVIYDNSTINIQPNGSTSSAREVGEAMHIIFERDVVISHSNASSVFKLSRIGSITTKENANVIVNSMNSSLFNGSRASITLEPNSALQFVSGGSVFNSTDISELTIYENSNLDIQMNGTASTAYVISIAGNVSLKNNSKFSMQENAAVSTSVFNTPTTSSTKYWNNEGGHIRIVTNGNVANVFQKIDYTMSAGSFYASMNAASNKQQYQFEQINITSGDFSVIQNATYSGMSNPFSCKTLTMSGGSFHYNGYDKGNGPLFNSFSLSGSASYLYSATLQAGKGLEVGDSGTFTIRDHASLILDVDYASTYLLYTSSTMVVNEGTTVHINAKDTSLAGTLDGRITYFSGAATLSVLNPKSFSISSFTSVLAYGTQRKAFHFEGDQILTWGSYFEPSQLSIHSKDNYYENPALASYFIKGNLYTNGMFSNITSSYANEATSSGNPSSNFGFVSNIKTLAIGDRFLLNSSIANGGDTYVQGNATPNAKIEIIYKGISYVGISDDNGDFSIDTPELEGFETMEVIVSDGYYLYSKSTITVADTGTLEFLNVPATIPFGTNQIPLQETWVERDTADWSIVVKDTRQIKTNWRLYATATPLSSVDGTTLEDAIQFVKSDGTSEILSAAPKLIHLDNAGQNQTTISWASNKGILIHLFGGMGKKDTIYESSITWNLVDAP